MAHQTDERMSDADCWRLVREGDTDAFAMVVERHQSLVCSVAYSVVGNLSLSEDIAQDTFWIAWRERSSLESPDRLAAWLSGIARNVARQVRRRQSRPADAAKSLDSLTEPFDHDESPSDSIIAREQESLMWQALEQIPESYREPLILFYREDYSVTETALALELSEDTVRQRLSRGRAMLRAQVAEIVENGLRRSRPGRKFTIGVLAGLSAHSAGWNTAIAASGGAASSAVAAAGTVKSAATAAAGGLAGGLFGSLVGFAGGWIGAWVPAQLAPTVRERNLILKAGVRMFLASVVITATFLVIPRVWPQKFAGNPVFLIAVFGIFYAFMALETILFVRALRHIRSTSSPSDVPNPAALRRLLIEQSKRYQGRVYRSRATLLGLPLVDINVADPVVFEVGDQSAAAESERNAGVASGWIAIGDDARGILMAVGTRSSRGLLAFGSRTIGCISVGDIAFGIVAIGGLGFGVVGIGGLGLGIWAIGGGAIGWQAYGGGALAWDLACGGGAIAKYIAFGGLAIARDYAIGGSATALHANDPAARNLVLSHPAVVTFQAIVPNIRWLSLISTAVVLLPLLAMRRLMYRRI
jgi:zinc protease